MIASVSPNDDCDCREPQYDDSYEYTYTYTYTYTYK